MPEEKTWDIPTDRLSELDKRIKKLNKRATKTGNGSVSFEVIRTYNETYDVDKEHFSYEVSVVRLLGEVPVIKGYEFVAKLEHLEGGNIISKVPATYDIKLPEKYRDIKPLCDHCNKLRRRNDTFILRKDEVFYQIGRNCLADYLRTEDIADAIGIWRVLNWLEEAEGEDEEKIRASYGKPVYDLFEMLFWACAVVRVDGFYKKAMYHDDPDYRLSTGDIVAYLWATPYAGGREAWQAERNHYKRTDEDKERAKKIIEWVRNDLKNEENEYLHNLNVIFFNDWFDAKKLGLVCSAVSAYARHIEKLEKKDREPAKPSKHFGEVKKRYDFELTVKNFFEFTNDYMGQRTYGTCIIFMDDDGNQFKWFSSREQDVEKGDRFRVKGTVKKHDEYKGIAQTVLNRCKLEEIDEQSENPGLFDS